MLKKTLVLNTSQEVNLGKAAFEVFCAVLVAPLQEGYGGFDAEVVHQMVPGLEDMSYQQRLDTFGYIHWSVRD